MGSWRGADNVGSTACSPPATRLSRAATYCLILRQRSTTRPPRFSASWESPSSHRLSGSSWQRVCNHFATRNPRHLEGSCRAPPEPDRARTSASRRRRRTDHRTGGLQPHLQPDTHGTIVGVPSFGRIVLVSSRPLLRVSASGCYAGSRSESWRSSSSYSASASAPSALNVLLAKQRIVAVSVISRISVSSRPKARSTSTSA